MRKILACLTILSLLFSGCSRIQIEDSKQITRIDYTDFLDDLYKSKSSDDEIEYVIRDLDNNAIPELIIAENGVAHITVYTFSNTVVELGNHSFETGSTRLLYSDTPSYPGIFVCYSSGGLDHYGYLTIKDNRLVYEELWNEDYSGISAELGLNRKRIEELSSDKQLIEESRKAYEANKDLLFQLLNP